MRLIPRVGMLLIGYEPEPEAMPEAQQSFAALASTLEAQGLQPVLSTVPSMTRQQAVEEARKLWWQGIDLLLVVVGSWTDANIVIEAVREVGDTPFALFAFAEIGQGGRIGPKIAGYGLTGAIEAKNSLDQMGYKGKLRLFFGAIEDAEVIGEVVSYARAAAIRRKLRYANIGAVGYFPMGMYSCSFDAISLRERIGPMITNIGESQLLAAAERADHGAAAQIADQVLRDYRVEGVDRAELVENAKMYLGYRRLIEEQQLDAINTKCDPELAYKGARSACFSHSRLCDEGVMCGCEGDVHVTLSMMLLHYLSGKPVLFLDVVGADKKSNSLQFVSCGFAPMRPTDDTVGQMNMQVPPRKGVSQGYAFPAGKDLTLCRLDGDYPRGEYVLHIALGRSTETVKPQPEWPALEMSLEGAGAYRHFVENCTADHFAVVEGRYKNELMDLAALLDLRTIVTQ
jgi:L-fucose isomerase-like protein